MANAISHDDYKQLLAAGQAYVSKAQAADPEWRAWQATQGNLDTAGQAASPAKDYWAEYLQTLSPQQQLGFRQNMADSKSWTEPVGKVMSLIPYAVGAAGLAGAAGLLGGGGITAAGLEGAVGVPELGLAAQTGLGGAGTVAAGAGAAGAGSAGAGAAGAATAAGTAAAAGGGGAATVAGTGMTAAEIAKLAIGGAGTVGSLVAGKSAGDAGKDAMNSANAAANASTQLGRDWLNFTMQQYQDAAPARDQAAKTAEEVSRAQLAALTTNTELAKEYADYYRTTYVPLEKSIVADATGYDTPEKRQAAADSAMADVNKGFAAVNEANMRRLAASGIDPASTRAMSVMQGQDMAHATANAGAAYAARKGVETTGFARKMDAASLGRNLPSAQATSANTGINAGNSATGNAMTGLNAINSGVPQVQQAYNGAVGANVASGGLYNTAAQIAQRGDAYNASLWGSLGNSVGSWINSKQGTDMLNRWFGG